MPHTAHRRDVAQTDNTSGESSFRPSSKVSDARGQDVGQGAGHERIQRCTTNLHGQQAESDNVKTRMLGDRLQCETVRRAIVSHLDVLSRSRSRRHVLRIQQARLDLPHALSLFGRDISGVAGDHI